MAQFRCDKNQKLTIPVVPVFFLLWSSRLIVLYHGWLFFTLSFTVLKLPQGTKELCKNGVCHFSSPSIFSSHFITELSPHFSEMFHKNHLADCVKGEYSIWKFKPDPLMGNLFFTQCQDGPESGTGAFADDCECCTRAISTELVKYVHGHEFSICQGLLPWLGLLPINHMGGKNRVFIIKWTMAQGNQDKSGFIFNKTRLEHWVCSGLGYVFSHFGFNSLISFKITRFSSLNMCHHPLGEVGFFLLKHSCHNAIYIYIFFF